MQLAVQEAGVLRLVLASVASLIGKLLGKRGWFYIVAGHNINAIDGPTEGSMYPANKSAKLAPKDPDKVSDNIFKLLKTGDTKDLYSTLQGVVIIDANDLGQNVLGKSSNISLSDKYLAKIFTDNPLGQGTQSTPMCLVLRQENEK
jgi:asparagine synthase (glutamine-hydrolysing)